MSALVFERGCDGVADRVRLGCASVRSEQQLADEFQPVLLDVVQPYRCGARRLDWLDARLHHIRRYWHNTLALSIAPCQNHTMHENQRAAIRRRLEESKAGLKVDDDPWALVELLLDDNERLEEKIDSAVVCFPGEDF